MLKGLHLEVLTSGSNDFVSRATASPRGIRKIAPIVYNVQPYAITGRAVLAQDF
jgi:hypothetical protein